MASQKTVDYLLVIISFVCYYFLGYVIPRYDTLPLLASVGILFLAYFWIIKNSDDQSTSFWIMVSLVFRVSLLFSLPQLSDDFYRFIWDGRLLASGHHPFGALPSEYLTMNIAGVDQELYSHLNSKDYFAIYPPISQYVFWIAVKLSPTSILGSVMVMRVVMLLAEIGSILLMRSLLNKFNMPYKHSLLYALNPLIILELTGNLHFEALVIFFLLLTVFFFTRHQFHSAAISMAIAICAKMIPLILLPAIMGRMSWAKLLHFFLVVVLSCIIIFIPFLDWEVINSLQSVGLYFHKFEFNASIYYFVRELGFMIYGYNIIQTVGWKLALLVFVLIMSFVWIRIRQSREEQTERDNRTFFLEWMWMLFIYLLFTTTLHPWYISTLLMFSVFTPYRFVAVWTALIFLTYAGYAQDSFREILWLTTLEYLIVFGFLGYEIWRRRHTLYLPWKNRNLIQP